MMEKNNISQYMLELYHQNLVTPKERKQIEEALSSDEELRRRYEALADSDKEIRRRYPYPAPVPAVMRDVRKPGISKRGVFIRSRLSEKKRLLVGLGAAAVLICVFFFSFILGYRSKKPAEIAGISDPDNEIGRARGQEDTIKDLSISIYPIETREDHKEKDGIPNGTMLKEGDSLLVVYTTPPEGEYEGVIFAVNGMPGSDVTLLFPADMRDRPKLRNGRESLRLMYILDPETYFEIFFLVASQNPLKNVEAIIRTANEVLAGTSSAGEPGRNLETVLEKMYSAFEGYEVKHSYIRITN